MARRDALTGRDGSTSRIANGGDEGEFKWHKIWHLSLQQSLDVCVAFSNSLPVRRNVANRGINITLYALFVEDSMKTCGHLFFKCKYAKLCWRLMNMEDIRAELVKCRSGV